MGYDSEDINLLHRMIKNHHAPPSRGEGLLNPNYRGVSNPDNLPGYVHCIPLSLYTSVVSICSQKGYRILEYVTPKQRNTFLHHCATDSTDLQLYEFLVDNNPRQLLARNAFGRRPLESSVYRSRPKAVVEYLQEMTDVAEKIDANLGFEDFKFEFALWLKI